MNINELIGKTILQIDMHYDLLIFRLENIAYQMVHYQDCCEMVTIEDVDGDLSDLVGSPILTAEEASNSGEEKDGSEDTYTWTFYKLSTAKGHVVIRWYGSSNSYYSESVNFEVLIKSEE